MGDRRRGSPPGTSRAGVTVTRREVFATAVSVVGVVVVLSIVVAAGARAAPSVTDRAILQAGVVQPRDLPTSWQQQPPRGTGRGKFAPIAACRQIQHVNDLGHRASHQESGTFFDPASLGHTTLASDVVIAFKDATRSSSFLAAYEDPRAATCLDKDFRRGLASRIRRLHPAITFAAIPGVQGIGDGSVGYEITISVTDRGQTQTVSNDNVIVKVGRAAIVLTTQNTGPLRDALLATIAARLAAAQASG
jgi:hypothetical protein